MLWRWWLLVAVLVKLSLSFTWLSSRGALLTIHHKNRALLAKVEEYGLDILECSGLDMTTEWPVVRNILADSVEGLTLNDEDVVMSSLDEPMIPGATGRVLCVRATGMTHDEIECLEEHFYSSMDELLYSETPLLEDPILLSLQDTFEERNLSSLVLDRVADYELRSLLPAFSNTSGNDEDGRFIPSRIIEVDGAFIDEPYCEEPVWDTSCAIVFDNLVSDELRERLLDVVRGSSDSKNVEAWNDVENGPDPKRWIRGGLADLPGQGDSAECWGLTDEGIRSICFQKHDAVEEMERLLSELFRDFDVARLPESVMGASVSPLTANAPTFGDTFSVHIDGDPQLAPPSPWTDVFGRYPNRSSGKPRFLSVLVYLNDEWDGKNWGAPTKLLDVATDTYIDVLPKPGRCLVMDQDLSHSVSAPFKAAGEQRPRYSLVWKLILHPKRARQNMRLLACGRSWPSETCVGSAARGTFDD